MCKVGERVHNYAALSNAATLESNLSKLVPIGTWTNIGNNVNLTNDVSKDLKKFGIWTDLWSKDGIFIIMEVLPPHS